MKSKWVSRKFLLSLAAFLASVGTSITGFTTGNKNLQIIGTVCVMLSSGIYAACEAYIDGKKVK